MRTARPIAAKTASRLLKEPRLGSGPHGGGEQHAAHADQHGADGRQVPPPRPLLGGLAEQHQAAAGDDELDQHETHGEPRLGDSRQGKDDTQEQRAHREEVPTRGARKIRQLGHSNGVR